MNSRIIAIDGPAGSGKSTTAKLVAQKLGFMYLDTGAMYRAITWKALRLGVDVDNEDKLKQLTENSVITFENKGGVNRIFLDGEEVTEKIREPQVNRNVSYVSMHKKVRRILVEMQRKMGQEKDLVAEGRDTTTVVFPQAFKVYLDADIGERAKRRFRELKEKQIDTTVDEQINDISRRDKLDSERETSPLLRLKDAVVVDTTHLTIEQQVDRVIELFKKREVERDTI